MSDVNIKSIRYGSIVHYKGRTCTVETINGTSSLYLYDVTKAEKNKPIVAMPSQVSGIRADSTRVLVKLGFTESGVSKNYEFGPISYNPAERIFYFNNVRMPYRVHVHQLQNIAFDWLETDRMLLTFKRQKEG